MEIKVVGYDRLIGLESDLKHFSDTSFKFYDLGDLHRRLNTHPIHPITQKLKESGLVLVIGFPMAMQVPIFLKECVEIYNPETKYILLPSQSILLSVNKELMQSTLEIPVKKEYCDIDCSSFASVFNKKNTLRRDDM